MNFKAMLKELKSHPELNVKTLTRKAWQGDITAQVYLCICYLAGLNGATKDPEEAIRLLELVAASNNAVALYSLGKCYANGLGVLENIDRAIELLQAAVKMGDDEAPLALANIYSTQRYDIAKAEYFYRLGSDRNNLIAKTILGYEYLFAERFAKNEEEGFQLVKSAAEQGCTMGKIILGVCYAEPKVVAKDYAEASKWIYSAIQSHDDLDEEDEYEDEYKKRMIKSTYDILSYLYELAPEIPEVIYRVAKIGGSTESLQALSVLAMKNPAIFDELTMHDTLHDLKKILSEECFAMVEERRKINATTMYEVLNLYIAQDVSKEVMKYLLPEQDLHTFFKRQSKKLTDDQELMTVEAKLLLV